MRFTVSPTELTTAASDAALALICLILLVLPLRMRVPATWKRTIWISVFTCLSIGSVFGAVAHGIDLPAPIRSMLFQPVNLSLGLAVALFVVGGVGDWRGERAARALLPWGIVVAAGFFVVTRMLARGFGVFIAYEAIAMVASLVIYLSLWNAGKHPGAGKVALGLALTLVAAAIQQSSLSARIIWPFDHNGLFHLVQAAAILTVASGLRPGLLGSSALEAQPRARVPSRGQGSPS